MLQAVVFFCIINRQTNKQKYAVQHDTLMSYRIVSATCFVLHEPSSDTFIYKNLKKKTWARFSICKYSNVCMGAAIC